MNERNGCVPIQLSAPSNAWSHQEKGFSVERESVEDIITKDPLCFEKTLLDIGESKKKRLSDPYDISPPTSQDMNNGSCVDNFVFSVSPLVKNEEQGDFLKEQETRKEQDCVPPFIQVGYPTSMIFFQEKGIADCPIPPFPVLKTTLHQLNVGNDQNLPSYPAIYWEEKGVAPRPIFQDLQEHVHFALEKFIPNGEDSPKIPVYPQEDYAIPFKNHEEGFPFLSSLNPLFVESQSPLKEASLSLEKVNLLMQLKDHFQTLLKNKESYLKVYLTPSDLGSIEIKIDLVKNTVLSTFIQTEKRETMELLSRYAQDINTIFQRSGLDSHITHIHFTANEEGNHQQEKGSKKPFFAPPSSDTEEKEDLDLLDGFINLKA